MHGVPTTERSDPYPAQVTAIIVTYGNRQHFVQPVMLRLQALGIKTVILVDNGSPWPIEAWIASLATLDFHLHYLPLAQNRGSAVGIAMGLLKAQELQAEFIWLLDDDNLPEHLALENLLKHYAQLQKIHARPRLAVLSFRPHRASEILGVGIQKVKNRWSSFMDFHFMDLPQKILRRLFRTTSAAAVPIPSRLSVAAAPYGGLFMHREVIETIGLPRADLVLYADDIEFTRRITQRGGHIYLITDSILVDEEPPWYMDASMPTNGFAKLLLGKSPLRAYYWTRNLVYLDAYSRTHDSFFYALNQKLYLFFLWILARVYHQPHRYHIIRQAIQDGLHQNLGIHPDFPLS